MSENDKKRELAANALHGLTLDQYIEKTPFVRALGEIMHVRDQPRLAVIISHGFVELMVNALVDKTCKNAKKITGNHRDFPHSLKLTLLHEKEVITDHHYRLLNWFRKLRNDAAHEAFFELSEVHLDIFAEGRHRDPAEFAVLSCEILVDLWQAYFHIIAETFAPLDFQIMSKVGFPKPSLGPDHLIPLKAG